MGENSLSEQAYKEVKEIIVSSQPGENISLRKASEQLNIGYTPIRDAFNRLEDEGLLNKVPNLGYFIPELSYKNLLEIFQARECLETFVMEKTFDTITKNDIIHLKTLVRKQKESLENNATIDFYKMDEEFHLLFFNIYNNDYFIDLIKNVREKYLFGTMQTILKNVGLNEAVSEHEELIKSIEGSNKQETIELMVKHINNSKTRAIKALGQ